MRVLRKALNLLWDLLFPRKCLSCGRIYPLVLCPDCLRELKPYLGKTCSICGAPLEGKGKLCPYCSTSPPPFTKAVFYGLYEGKIEEVILRFKFQDHPALAIPLGQLMAQAWQKQEIEADIVTSVPLSKRRLRLRGYNQAELLAKTIAHGLGLPYQELLVRKRHVKEQSRLKREERLTNVLGAFAPIDGLDLGGKRVLLVDDVLTTGATTSECSRALLKAGASSVYVLTMARGTGTQRMSS